MFHDVNDVAGGDGARVSCDYVGCRLGVDASSVSAEQTTTYQSAHMTTSKRPSIVDTSRSLSHLTTLKENTSDYEVCENDKQRNMKKLTLESNE